MVAFAQLVRGDDLYVGVWLVYPVLVYDFIIGFELGDYDFLFGIRARLPVSNEPVQYLQGLSS